MAVQAPLANDKKRVKVYELRDNDWFDRGTGFCTGQVINEEPRIFVESEDQPERMLLETRIVKDDGYQKQQGQHKELSARRQPLLTHCRYSNCLDREQWH